MIYGEVGSEDKRCGECKALNRSCPSETVVWESSAAVLVRDEDLRTVVEDQAKRISELQERGNALQFLLHAHIKWLAEANAELKVMTEDRDEYQATANRQRQDLLDLHAAEARRLMGLPKKSPWKSQVASAVDDGSFVDG